MEIVYFASSLLMRWGGYFSLNPAETHIFGATPRHRPGKSTGHEIPAAYAIARTVQCVASCLGGQHWHHHAAMSKKATACGFEPCTGCGASCRPRASQPSPGPCNTPVCPKDAACRAKVVGYTLPFSTILQSCVSHDPHTFDPDNLAREVPAMYRNARRWTSRPLLVDSLVPRWLTVGGKFRHHRSLPDQHL